jgi:hypothetical protein
LVARRVAGWAVTDTAHSSHSEERKEREDRKATFY